MWLVHTIGRLGLVPILSAYWLTSSGRTAAQSAIYRCARSSPTPRNAAGDKPPRYGRGRLLTERDLAFTPDHRNAAGDQPPRYW